MALSEKDLEQAKRELSQQALKVYEVVPIGEFWDKKAIVAQLVRMKVGMQVETIHGCLATLVRTKLVDERSGTFRRAPVRATMSPAPKPAVESVAPAAPAPATKKEEEGLADRLLRLAIRVTDCQAQIAAQASALTDLIEELQEASDAVAKLPVGISPEELQMVRAMQALMVKR